MDRMQSCIRFDPLGVASRSATLLPPCTLVMYLTLVTTALGVALATVIAQDPWLGTRTPAVLLEKCHRGKLKLQPVWLGYQHCFWYSWTHALCGSPFSPLSLPPGNLNPRDQMKISSQQFLFFLPSPHAFNHRSSFREKYVQSQRHMWVWKRALSKAFLQVKKTTNSFCNILSSLGDLCKAQGVLYIHLKLKQSWKTSKTLQLLGGVGVNEQVHTKAKSSQVVFLSCFVIIKQVWG